VADNYVFHVRNAHPEDMVAILTTLETYPGLTSASILEHAETMGFAIRDRQRLEALMTARDLGLVENQDNQLTPLGTAFETLAQGKPALFANLIHYLTYTLWSEACPGQYCFSWTYRNCCDLLWQAANLILQDRRKIAADIVATAKHVFGLDSISLSPKSIGGILLWLMRLEPRVCDEEGMTFFRRTFCPPELFVLAVDYLYGLEGATYGSNVLLDQRRREIICKVCLLDPARFERVLDYAVPQFPYLERGVGGGWGTYVLLQQKPEIEGFLY
jgi:hypothetical protein